MFTSYIRMFGFYINFHLIVFYKIDYRKLLLVNFNVYFEVYVVFVMFIGY